MCGCSGLSTLPSKVYVLPVDAPSTSLSPAGHRRECSVKDAESAFLGHAAGVFGGTRHGYPIGDGQEVGRIVSV